MSDMYNFEQGNAIEDSGSGVSVNNRHVAAQTPPPSIVNDPYCVTSNDSGIEQEQQQTAVNMGYQEYQPFLEPPPLTVRILPDPESASIKRWEFYMRIGSAVFVIIFFIFFLLAASGAGSGIMGKSHHRLIEKCDVKFSDIQGCDEVKEHLEKIVMFLKDPTDFQRFGAKMPRGYLLAGPPGVGKTMLAKAVAGESGVPFLTISGAEFEEVFVGVGAKRVRELFDDARKFQKAVIFIDEIDAIAGKRGKMGGDDRSRQTMNQLLVEMDGFNSKEGIVVLAATNTPDILDSAILRPGRFDKTFHLSPPDIKGREKLLKELFKAIPNDKLEEGDLKKMELMWLAKLTVGYTGADLANLINHAKMLASMDKDAKVITKKHVLEAKDFVDMGPKRELVMTKEEKERTAYHEAGHAIVSLINEGAFSVQYATIVPHGEALGLVMNVPDVDLQSMSLQMLESRMDVCMGGFMGEKFRFGNDIGNDMKNVSTGASSDFKQANNIAAQIVTAGFGKRTKMLLPTEYASEASKQNFEEDMKDFLDASAKRVEDLLKNDKNSPKFWVRSAWIELAEALLKENSLNRDEIVAIYQKHKPAIF